MTVGGSPPQSVQRRRGAQAPRRRHVSGRATAMRGQRELLSVKFADSRSDTVPGSGQYIQEEQPAAAVARLDEASR